MQDRQTNKKIEECRLKVSHILQSCFTSDGCRRFATPPQQVSAFNKRCQPVIDEWSPLSPSLLIPKNDIVIGNDVSFSKLFGVSQFISKYDKFSRSLLD